MKLSDPRTLRSFASSIDVQLGSQGNRVAEAADAVYRRWPDIVPEVSDEDALSQLRRMATRQRNGDWQGAKLREVLVAARIAFSRRWIEDERLTPFREFIIAQTTDTTHGGLRKVMFDLYISSYIEGASHTHRLAQILGSVYQRLSKSQQSLLEAVPEILDPKDAPKRIAQRLVAESNPIDAMNSWGLKENYDDGLMLQLYEATVNCFKPLLANGSSTELERFLIWLRPDGNNPRQRGAGNAIDAVLQPWLSRTPDLNYQADVISGLVATFGDPRLKRSAAWDEASEASMGLISRWLTGETMLIFLKAISKTNNDAMWKPRRTFWMGLYEDGQIDEAWVAFADEAYNAAQGMAKTDHERELYAGFGRQIAQGSRRNTSLLVLRIGRRIIVEGSHNYKVQLFEFSNPSRPELYKQAYDCEDIRRLSDEQKTHTEGSWQRWVRQKVL